MSSTLPLLKEIEKYLVLKAKEGDKKSIFGRPATFRSGEWIIDDSGSAKEPEDKNEKPKESESIQDLPNHTEDEKYGGLSNRVLSSVDLDLVPSLSSYMDNSFDINGSLRGFTGGATSESDLEKQIADLDKAFEQASLSGDVPILWRGALMNKSVLSKLTNGDVIKDKSFLSTSSDKETANDFMEQADFAAADEETPVLFKIITSSGRKVLPLANLSEEWSFQKEILLNRDSELKVFNIKKKDDHTVIEVSV